MLVSILTPTYNRAGFLGEALRSAVQQDYPDTEIVVVDDGSTDNTRDVVEEIGDPRIRYVMGEHGGVARARNLAVSEARGEFVLWLDSDDRLLPDAIRTYVDAHRKHPQTDIWYGQLWLIDEHGKRLGEKRYRTVPKQELIPALVHGGICPQPGAFIRRAIFERVGLYDPAVDGTEDYDFFSRAAEFCEFEAVPAHTCEYRVHESQLMGVDNDSSRNFDLVVIERMVERYGTRRLFPDLYEADASVGDAASFLRLTNIYHERRGPGRGRDAFIDAKRMLSSVAGLSPRVEREAVKLLYQVGLSDRAAFRAYARELRTLLPQSRAIRKQHILSRLPSFLHRALRR